MILILSIHIAATATNYNDLAICTVLLPQGRVVLKPSKCIAGRLRRILNEKYRIVQSVVYSKGHYYGVCNLFLQVRFTSFQGSSQYSKYQYSIFRD